MRIVFVSTDPALFDRSEVIGVGKQAALEIAVDDTAVKGRWEPPPERPVQMPGQGGLDFTEES